MFFRQNPGPCPICGQAHTACTGSSSTGPIEITQLPARDAALATSRASAPAASPPAAPAPAEPFSTAEYRGTDTATGQPIVDRKKRR